MSTRAGAVIGAVSVVVACLAGCSSSGAKPSVVTDATTATKTVTATVTTTSQPSSTTSPGVGDFSVFSGPWQGHTRRLTVTASGVAVESVNDGCCTFVYAMTLQLSNPAGTLTNAKATAEVVAVTVGPNYPGSLPRPPDVGARGEVTIKSGIFTDPWFGTTFCDHQQASVSACGA